MIIVIICVIVLLLLLVLLLSQGDRRQMQRGCPYCRHKPMDCPCEKCQRMEVEDCGCN